MPIDDKPTYAKNYLISKWKISPIVASGIVGNLQAESGLSTKAWGDNNTSYGIAQWHNERKDGLLNFAKKQNKDASHLDTQLDYLVYELNTSQKSALNKINKASTPEEAAVAFMNHFERPAEWAKKESVGKRVGYAKKVYNGKNSEVVESIDYTQPAEENNQDYLLQYTGQDDFSGQNPQNILDVQDEEPTKQFKSDLAKDRLVQKEKQDILLSQLSGLFQQQEQPQQQEAQQEEQIDPSLYQVYNIEHPEYNIPQFQQGGEYTPKQFYSEYINSPKYKQRLYQMGRIDADQVIKDRLQNLFHTDVFDVNGVGSQYMAEDNAILLDNGEIAKYGMDKNQLWTHELSHALGSRENNKKATSSFKLNKAETSNINKRNIIPTLKPKDAEQWSQYLHDSLPSEAKADLDALRYQLRKDKLYDTGTQDFTPELLKKAKEKYGKDFIIKRNFKAFKDEDLIWLMNNIASNRSKEEDNVFYAQQGGKMPQFKPILADNTRVQYPTLPSDNSDKQINKSKQQVNANNTAIKEWNYYNPEYRPNITSGDKMVDLVYQNKWLMDLPAIGSYIKNEAYKTATNSHGSAIVGSNKIRKPGNGGYDGAWIDTEGTVVPKLLDVYFGKKQLPKSTYRPSSDYLEFLPSYSVKQYFDKNISKAEYKQSFKDYVSYLTKEKDYKKSPIFNQDNENTDLTSIMGVDLGGHKEGVAYDKEIGLPYVSISDAWDFEPGSYSKKWKQDVNDPNDKNSESKAYIQASLMHRAGKPFKIYDRFYFDPKTKEYIPDSEIEKIKNKSKKTQSNEK